MTDAISRFRHCVLLVLVAGLAGATSLASGRAERVVQPPADGAVHGTRLAPVATAIVNFTELAQLEQDRALTSPSSAPEAHAEIPLLTIDEETGKTRVTSGAPHAPGAAPEMSPADTTPPLGPSPAPAIAYAGQEDEAKVGTSAFITPPDTMGAVGLTRVMATMNNNYLIQDKATGATISKVSIDTFWAATGGAGFFDPRTTYDPYNDRWLLAAASNSSSASSSLVLAVSATSDPSGNWYLGRLDADFGDTLWADFPIVGFNKKWVTVTVNMFTISTGAFTEGRVFALDYARMRGGTFAALFFTGITAADGGFAMNPAFTYSPVEETEYLVSHVSSTSASYKLSTLTGPSTFPALTIGATKTLPPSIGGGTAGWTQTGGDILPQQCTSGCPPTLRFIDSGDSFIRGLVVYRNGNLYYSQTIGIGPSGPGTTPVQRTGVQWVEINTSGDFVQGGRIIDPGATSAIGNWYAYSSLAVNRNNDVLVGFSRFAATQFAAAGYAFRSGTDPAGTMGDVLIYKTGEDYYQKTFGGSRNRWGDFSSTIVDPVNDRDLWTIQEYAKLRAVPGGLGTNDARWGTFWARVRTPGPPSISNVADRTIHANRDTGAIAFTVDDVETPAASLVVSGSSSNTTLVPNANILFAGSGGSRTVTVTPAASQSGVATITLTVTDGSALSESDTFVLTVTPNMPPAITDIMDQFTSPGTATPPLAFTIDDDDGVAGLTVAGSSSNQALVPNANIVFSGSGASRFVTVTPTNTTGTATITITVTDPYGMSSSDTFILTSLSVPPPNLGVFRPGIGRWFINSMPPVDWGVAGDMPVPGDYDGDGIRDVAVFRPSNGTWYVNGGATAVWGAPGDIPAPGDYDGDHITDMAVFRPSAGIFYVRNVGTFTWGLAGDLPAVGDYNGDGLADVAVYRPSNGTWYIRNVGTFVYGFAADIPVPADYDGNGVIDIAVFRPATGTWFIKDQYSQGWGLPGDVPIAMDRDGDNRAELGVFRRATGMWYFKNHVTGAAETRLWGAPGDIPLGRAMPPVQTPWGDYDGDRKADLTVFRPSTGDWVSLRSLSGMTDHTVHTFGLSTDVPVGRDFDGDGKIDPAVFRPATGYWFVLQSSTNYSTSVTQEWGLSTDTAVPADYDGDGKADIAVFRPSLGRWLILLSSSNATVQYDWGLSTDIPVPADYDGDGVADLAVFRPSTGRWFVLNRLTGALMMRDWGMSGDIPAAADFDGDGKADIAIFRPSLGRWFITSSIDGSYVAIDWGLSDDSVVPADYDADGKADIAVYRPSSGTWYVRGLFNRKWGIAGDIPALAR